MRKITLKHGYLLQNSDPTANAPISVRCAVT